MWHDITHTSSAHSSHLFMFKHQGGESQKWVRNPDRHVTHWHKFVITVIHVQYHICDTSCCDLYIFVALYAFLLQMVETCNKGPGLNWGNRGSWSGPFTPEAQGHLFGSYISSVVCTWSQKLEDWEVLTRGAHSTGFHHGSFQENLFKPLSHSYRGVHCHFNSLLAPCLSPNRDNNCKNNSCQKIPLTFVPSKQSCLPP